MKNINNLTALAKQFLKKASTPSNDKESKKIKKTAAINKIASGAITVKTAQCKIPGIYLICSDCHGLGKSIKLGSVKSGSLTQKTSIIKCFKCDGKRVIKIANIHKCSEEQVKDRENYLEDKAQNKALKKEEKRKKKIAKLVAKAEQKRIEAENPLAFHAQKIKKKAERKADKAAKKATKAINKVKNES